ncbi:MAG TPA: ABC transporter permease [Candidatus Limnocylindrales bacterium]|jgi:putative ABC transport system permease protein|nr:ABC transporter permease [Candidatus Limnocylindrales bacterium]
MIRYIFSEALNALSHYRLRSALTMLSIIWGVASLMLLLSYGEGFDRALTTAFMQIGKDLVVVFPGQTSLQAGGERSGRRIHLELTDVQAIQEGVPTIEAVSPEVRRFWPVSYQDRTRSYGISGVYASFERIRSAALASGRYLSEEDVLHRRRVVVIGENIRHELFSGMPALGNEIKIQGVRFTIIGILEKKTQISNYSSPDDMTAFIPFTTLGGLTDTRYLDDIVLLPASNQFRDRIVTDIRSSLARAHNFNVTDTRAVEIIEWNKFLALITNVSLGLKILLTIIGTFTLSIGAVGVINIMLVSVTERTKEIGVLKALGARRRHILLQILFEGLVLTLSGGLLGFLLAAVLVRLIGSLPFLGPLFEDTSGRGDIHLMVSLSALLISSSILTGVGIIAGMIPAFRASRLDPVLAMRSE